MFLYIYKYAYACINIYIYIPLNKCTQIQCMHTSIPFYYEIFVWPRHLSGRLDTHFFYQIFDAKLILPIYVYMFIQLFIFIFVNVNTYLYF